MDDNTQPITGDQPQGMPMDDQTKTDAAIPTTTPAEESVVGDTPADIPAPATSVEAPMEAPAESVVEEPVQEAESFESEEASEDQATL